MVRTVKSHHEEEEDDDEFILRTTDNSSQKDGRRSDQKSSSHRSKHSETEQRRRSKINERFQILRDLIPENDQKRDKASFLLEVIQYIQFLQEKLQMYEGTYQGWSPEPSKLMPWNLVESDMNGSAAYKATDHGAAAQPVSINMPLQSNLFEAEPSQSPHGSFSDTDQLASQSRPQPWNVRPFSTEGAIPTYIPNEQEELRMQSEEASISNAYSKGLLNNLTHALGSSGVDLSRASISVQLDIWKGISGGVTSTIFATKDHQCLSPGNQAMAQSSGEGCDQPHKRPRTGQN